MFRPHKYQREVIDFCLDRFLVQRARGAGLLLDPGLGKTACTLSVLDALDAIGDFQRALVIAPVRVVRNVWPQEVKKWGFDLPVSVVHGTPAQRERALSSRAKLHLINPEGVDWLVNSARNFKASDYCTLVLDESTKFKNWSAKRSKALRKIIPKFKHRMILTGTPSPNGLQDLFAQAYVLDEGQALGKTLTQFRNRFCRRGGYLGHSWLVRSEMRKEIEEAIRPLVIRMDAADHLDLPPLMFNDVWVDLPGPAMKTYKEIEKELVAYLKSGETLTANGAGAAYAKCKQIANGGSFLESGEVVHLHSAKLDALEELIDESHGKPVLVGYQFKHDLERLLDRWPDTPSIGGHTTPVATTRILEQWNAGQLPLLFCQPMAVGHGLNMQTAGCNHVVWLGLTDSLEVYEQFNRRVYRQGAVGTVVVHHLLARGTVEEAIQTRVRQKGVSQAELLAALKQYFEGRA